MEDRRDMDKNEGIAMEHREGLRGMDTPPIVSSKEWETALQQMLAKEKEFTHARDALAAERRRMPWMVVEKAYAFNGPDGRAACSTCSTADDRWSSTALSSSPASRAGPTTPASAAPWWPIR